MLNNELEEVFRRWYPPFPVKAKARLTLLLSNITRRSQPLIGAAADLIKNPPRYLESERPEGADFLHEVLSKNLLESGALTA